MTTVLDIIATIRPSLVLPHSENVRPYQLLTRDQAASVVPGTLNTFNVPRPLPVVEKVTYPLLSRDQAATNATVATPLPPATPTAPVHSTPLPTILKEVNEISNSVSEVVVKAEVHQPAKKDSVVAHVVSPTPPPTPAPTPAAPTPAAPAKASIMNFFTKKPSEATISNGAPRTSEVKTSVESTLGVAQQVKELPPPSPSTATEVVPSVSARQDVDEDDTPLSELFHQPAVVKRAPLSADMAALLAEGDEEDDNVPSTTLENQSNQPKAKKAPAEKKPSAAKKPVVPLEPVVQAAVLSSINDEVVVTAFANPFLSAAPASVPCASISNGVGAKRAREEAADNQTHNSLDGRSAEHSKTASDVTSKPTPAKKPSAAKAPEAVVNTATASASVLKAFCSPELAAFQRAYSTKTKSTVKLDPITNVYHCSEVTVYVENATGSEISSEEHRQLREDIMARLKVSAAEVAAAAVVEPKLAAAAPEATTVAKKAPAASAPAKMAKAPSTKKSRTEAASVGYKTNPLACLFGNK